MPVVMTRSCQFQLALIFSKGLGVRITGTEVLQENQRVGTAWVLDRDPFAGRILAGIRSPAGIAPCISFPVRT